MVEHNLPPPTHIALVICDSVYHDSAGKRALVGLFDRIEASGFPAVHSHFCVFVAITSTRHNSHCKLEIVNSREEPIVTMESPITGGTPRAILEIIFELNNVSFPAAGQYMIRFFGNDQILGQRPIEIVSMTEPDNSDEDQEYDLRG